VAYDPLAFLPEYRAIPVFRRRRKRQSTVNAKAFWENAQCLLTTCVESTRREWRMSKDKPVGSVMVLGGGIAGMQSAIDLAESGYYVYLVEKTSAIGGLMSQLDKTFPTNDCAM
jgi:heterodisulfide reductase subunit A